MKKLLLATALSVAVLTSGDAFAQKVSYVDPSWQTSLMQQLQRFKRYPAEAQTRFEQGAVLLSLSLDRNGHVLAHSIARSSGHADLDNEVTEMIKRAEPLPPFPASMTQARIDLTVPIRFSLLPAAEAQVTLDRGEITPAAPVTTCDGNQRSVFYRVINNTRDAVKVTVQCDFSGADETILSSATAHTMSYGIGKYRARGEYFEALEIGIAAGAFQTSKGSRT